MIYIKKIQNKIRYLSNLNKLKKENKKLGRKGNGRSFQGFG